MPTHWIHRLRNHWHALLILPLIVIVMTWPTFARIFDADEFWLHSQNYFDVFQKMWDAWHLERVLAGKTAIYHTDAMFHPQGISLAFHGMTAPHAFLLLALQQLIPADDAYNLLYLLMLCFNAFCIYVLINHLLNDRWIALFGAVVGGVHVYFTYFVTAPAVLLVGTIPLTVYFLHRTAMERRWLFAFLTGVCAGITAFIGLRVFLFLQISVGIYAIYLSIHLWRAPGFWRRLLLIAAVCMSISLIRIYPINSDAALQEGLGFFLETNLSSDVLSFFVHSRNPFTGDFLHAVLGATHQVNFKYSYLGYINLVFIFIAVLRAPRRQPLTPWLVTLVAFAVLSLGYFLTFNGQAHAGFALPTGMLSNLFPFIFGAVRNPTFYLLGVVTPLALLSCYGLAHLLRAKPDRARAAFALLSILILMFEYYQRPAGYVVEREKTAYIDWLQSEDQSSVKIIDLPRGSLNSTYYLYTQSLSGYPTAFGFANRLKRSGIRSIFGNYLLENWRAYLPAVCLPGHTSAPYLDSLDKLLRDGFTHIVLHRWLPAKGDLAPGFVNVPAAYEDQYVSVYRLADMRLNCEAPSTLPRFNHFTNATWVLPGRGSAVLSYHPGQSIDQDVFAYLSMLLSDWDNFHHLYQHNGEWKMQSANQSDALGDNSDETRRIIYLIFDADDGPSTLPASIEFRNDFNLCQREAYEEGSVVELWLNPRFSCALVEPSDSPRVEYDNGALLETMLYDFNQDIFDLQILWRNLPDKTHSLSVQLFNDDGDKVHGQDFVIGSRSITGHSVDLSSLPPGDYIVKLIFYRYSTGQSVSGTVSSSGASFERALPIASIHKT